MMDQEVLKARLEAVYDVLRKKAKHIPTYKISDLSGVKKRKINWMLRGRDLVNGLTLKEYLAIYEALTKLERVENGQNLYGVHLHHATRFRSPSKPGNSSGKR